MGVLREQGFAWGSRDQGTIARLTATINYGFDSHHSSANYLLWVKTCSISSALDEVLSTVTDALKKTQSKLDAETDDAKKLMYTKTISRANAALEKLNEMKNNAPQSPAEEIAVGGRCLYYVY